MRTGAEFRPNVRSCERDRMFQIEGQKMAAKYRPILGPFVAFIRKLIRRKKRIKCDNRLDINERYAKFVNDRGEYGCPAKH